MSNTKTFRKGDTVIRAGVWTPGVERHRDGTRSAPAIYVSVARELGSMGKKQGFVWIAEGDKAARERIYARNLGHSIFHAADEAEAIAAARDALRRDLEGTLRSSTMNAENHENGFGFWAKRRDHVAALVEARVWETCEVVRDKVWAD